MSEQLFQRPVPPVPPPLPPLPLAPEPVPARRSLLELILDPRSIQWLLGSGGCLLVAGLVIWLASLGLFDNPWIVASAMGVATLGIMAGGWSLIQRTRFTLAGRATTLLACLVMPLNLWFYHANHLLTIDGHLWLAAVACCILYAASALILADALFVYVLLAGVTATGMLILADLHRLAEIASPSLMLMVLSLITLHIERAFINDDSHPFSRSKFGKACFLASQALLVGSLGLLAGGQIFGYLGLTPITGQLPAIITDSSLQLLAIAITLLGAYACVYTALVIRKSASYFFPAIALVLWGELQAIHTLHLTQFPAAIILTLSLTSLAIHLLSYFFRDDAFTPSLRTIVTTLGILPILYGIKVFFTTDLAALPQSQYLGFAGSMVVAAAASRWNAYLVRKIQTESRLCIAATACSLLVVLSSLLGRFGFTNTLEQAPWLMLLPVGYMLSAALRRTCAFRSTHIFIGDTLIALVLFLAIGGAATLSGWAMPMAIVLALVALSYVLGLIAEPARSLYATLACIATYACTFCLLSHTDASNLTCILAFAGVALAHITTGRLLAGRVTAIANAITFAGQSFLSILLAGQLLFTGARIIGNHAILNNAFAILAMAFATLLAAGLSKPSWKRWFTTASIGQAIFAIGVLAHLSHLTVAQRFEIFSVISGLLLLVLGYLGWYREQSQSTRSDMTTLALAFGSLLVCLPLLIAVIAHRYDGGLSMPDELALLTFGSALFVTGTLCRIRSTTLCGASAVAIHLAILIISAGMRAQLAIGVYLALGGGLLFLAGLLLSIYRDKIRELPSSIHQRQGIFSVLSWR